MAGPTVGSRRAAWAGTDLQAREPIISNEKMKTNVYRYMLES